MRHNFVNDIGDYVKYALLRTLCTEGTDDVRLGVVWYLTDHVESNGDGRRRPHLSRDGWSDLDSELLVKMRAIEQTLTSKNDLHLSLVERSSIFTASTIFFSEALPESSYPARLRVQQRAAWFARAREAVTACDIVFLDPDNGLEVRSVAPTSRLASKYVRVAEISSLLSIGASVVLYQHCDRSPWSTQRSRIQRQIASGVPRPVSIRSLRFSAFGGRAFFCISGSREIAIRIDNSLGAIQERVASWDKAHHLLIE